MSDVVAPLPRGRHNLSRDEVETSQRLRLALAMADACGEHGYTNTSVKAVLERAGVSRLTFYELYDDKLACFLDTLELVGAVLVDRLRTAFGDGGGRPVDRAADAVTEYLEMLADNLAFARLYIVEAHAAGPTALIRRAGLQGQVVDALAGAIDATDGPNRFACEMYVGAVSALVSVPVATAGRSALRALRDPLVIQLRALAASIVTEPA